MEEKEMITIQNNDGSTLNAELITYSISEDNQNSYMVYSKGEKTGVEQDEVIYIARVVQEGATKKICEIVDDTEWASVQKLLKKIANA